MRPEVLKTMLEKETDMGQKKGLQRHRVFAFLSP